MSTPLPARGAPDRIVHEGRYVRLEPIAAKHVPALYDAASASGAEERFRYLFSHPPTSEADLSQWVEAAAVKDLGTNWEQALPNRMRLLAPPSGDSSPSRV